jgi:hypothetical protein
MSYVTQGRHGLVLYSGPKLSLWVSHLKQTQSAPVLYLCNFSQVVAHQEGAFYHKELKARRAALHGILPSWIGGAGRGGGLIGTVIDAAAKSDSTAWPGRSCSAAINSQIL